MTHTSAAEETKVVAIESLHGKTYFDLGYSILDTKTMFNPDELLRAGSDVIALARLAVQDPEWRRCLDTVRTGNPFDSRSPSGCFVRVVNGLEFEWTYPQLTTNAVHEIVWQIRDRFAQTLALIF